MRRALIIAIALLALALAWGAWHASTHATLRVSLRDVSLASDGMAYEPVRSAQLVFLDAQGHPLASGSIAAPWGLFAAQHPQVGDCRSEEVAAVRNAASASGWRECFAAQSRWLPQWVPQVKSANVTLAACAIERVPVEIGETRDDWWLWWVPLPHVGGRPYTAYDLTLWIDGRHCRAASPSATA